MGALVDRIKAEAADANEEGFCVVPEGVLIEAAAHIERLEAEVVTIKASCSLAAADAVRFQDERDRLQAALAIEKKNYELLAGYSDGQHQHIVEIEANARRYLWLRDTGCHYKQVFPCVLLHDSSKAESRDRLDAAIDAALSAQRGVE